MATYAPIVLAEFITSVLLCAYCSGKPLCYYAPIVMATYALLRAYWCGKFYNLCVWWGV